MITFGRYLPNENLMNEISYNEEDSNYFFMIIQIIKQVSETKY